MALDWNDIDATAVNPPREEEVRGAMVRVMISPHNVPTHFRSDWNPLSRTLLIEFRYLDDESWHWRAVSGRARIGVGKHSGRLYAIELSDFDSHGEPLIEVATRAIDHMPEIPGIRHDQLMRGRETTKAVLARYANELVPG